MKNSIGIFFIILIFTSIFLLRCKKNTEGDSCENNINEFVGNYSGERTEPGDWSIWNTEITKSSTKSNNIVIKCFPSLCFTIEAKVCLYNLSIPETIFYRIPATSHGGSVVEYYYDEIISGSGILANNNLQIDYDRKMRKTGDTIIFRRINGHLNINKK